MPVLFGHSSTHLVIEPFGKFHLYEWLDSLPARQSPVELVAFTLNPNAYIEERAARVFQWSDLSQSIVCSRVP